MLNIAAFTGGVSVPSARFRVRQHIPALMEQKVSVTEMPSYFGTYPPKQKWLRPLWAGASLLDRVPSIVRSHQFDVVLLQREFLSSFVTLEGLTKRPRVLDVDDAIFLYRHGHCAKKLAQLSDRIICGNNYLANWFSAWNRNISVVPTAIDANKYVPLVKCEKLPDHVLIGWIGTSGNLKYLYAIERALACVLNSHDNAMLRIVCDVKPDFRFIDPMRVDFVQWCEAGEVASIQEMDIGIMPLLESDWANGKCSFKMIQYMSCAIPVVVSPVGMNAEVLADGNVGYSAESESDWVDCISALLESADLRAAMGKKGRQVVIEKYSVERIAPKIAAALRF